MDQAYEATEEEIKYFSEYFKMYSKLVELHQEAINYLQENKQHERLAELYDNINDTTKQLMEDFDPNKINETIFEDQNTIDSEDIEYMPGDEHDDEYYYNKFTGKIVSKNGKE